MSTENQQLFRKIALERLSSPDRLDALLGLNRPRWPLVWAGASLALGALLFWGFQGSVAQKVVGRCILTSPSGVAEITAVAAGRVSGVALKVGDQVVAGQEIARIVRPELFEQTAQARARLAELERRRADVQRLGRAAGDSGRHSRAAEAASIAEQARLAAERATALERRLGVERELLGQGLITRQALLDTEEALRNSILERERLRDRAKQMTLQGAEEERQRNREEAAVSFQVSEARRALDALLDIERQTAPVITPYAGRVIELKVNNGVSVGFGSALMQIERSEGVGETLEAAIYVAGGEGKLIALGMPVEIVPDYVKRQEYGFLRARVEQVSEYPASLPGMRLLVQNDNLLKELSGQRAAIFARARLEQGAGGAFVWSAAASRPPPVRSGALCQAEVTVGERRPIALLVPMLRRWLGLA